MDNLKLCIKKYDDLSKKELKKLEDNNFKTEKAAENCISKIKEYGELVVFLRELDFRRWEDVVKDKVRKS